MQIRWRSSSAGGLEHDPDSTQSRRIGSSLTCQSGVVSEAEHWHLCKLGTVGAGPLNKATRKAPEDGDKIVTWLPPGPPDPSGPIRWSRSLAVVALAAVIGAIAAVVGVRAMSSGPRSGFAVAIVLAVLDVAILIGWGRRLRERGHYSEPPIGG